MSEAERDVSGGQVFYGRVAPFDRQTEGMRAHVFSRRYLVDPASSHMLVPKIKPCKSIVQSEHRKLRMAHYISYNLLDDDVLHGYPRQIRG